LSDHPDITGLGAEIARRVKARINPLDLRERIIVPVGVSARHIHLTREVLESLFGAGYELRVRRKLSQPGEFAAEEAVAIVGPRGRAIEDVRLLGPVRTFTQIELARSDGLRLGVDLPVRKSGDLEGSPGLTLIGPHGTVVLKEGAIRATRHIHMTEADASRFRLRNGQLVRVRTQGDRAVVFENVLVRVSDRFLLDFHIDTDDANATGLDTGCFVEVLV
jgi:putative phosphotransacetylase